MPIRFFKDCHKDKRFDFFLANPPFNLKDWGADQLKDDRRWKYGTPPEGNANFAWLQHMIYHLYEDHGRIGMVLANGSLSSQTGGEGRIRQAIVDDDLVEGIIAMPSQAILQYGHSCFPLDSRQKQEAPWGNAIRRCS